VDDLKANVKAVVDKYYSIQEKSVSVFFPTTHDHVKLTATLFKENPRMLVSNETVADNDPSIVDWRFIARSDISSILLSETIVVKENLTREAPYGSLFNVTDEKLKNMADRLRDLSLMMKLISLDSSVQGYPNCYKWTIQFMFDFVGGRVPMKLVHSYGMCF